MDRSKAKDHSEVKKLLSTKKLVSEPFLSRNHLTFTNRTAKMSSSLILLLNVLSTSQILAGDRLFNIHIPVDPIEAIAAQAQSFLTSNALAALSRTNSRLCQMTEKALKSQSEEPLRREITLRLIRLPGKLCGYQMDRESKWFTVPRDRVAKQLLYGFDACIDHWMSTHFNDSESFQNSVRTLKALVADYQTKFADQLIPMHHFRVRDDDHYEFYGLYQECKWYVLLP